MTTPFMKRHGATLPQKKKPKKKSPKKIIRTVFYGQIPMQEQSNLVSELLGYPDTPHYRALAMGFARELKAKGFRIAKRSAIEVGKQIQASIERSRLRKETQKELNDTLPTARA